MDALREWMESDLDVIMVGTWMLCSWKTQKHRVPRGFRHVKYEEVRELPRIPRFFAVPEAVRARANAMMVGIIRNPQKV